MFAFHLPAYLSNSPSFPVLPRNSPAKSVLPCSVQPNLTERYSQPFTLPQNARTHHRQISRENRGARECREGAGKAATGASSCIVVGPFCSPCSFWYFRFLQGTSWAFQLKPIKKSK